MRNQLFHACQMALYIRNFFPQKSLHPFTERRKTAENHCKTL